MRPMLTMMRIAHHSPHSLRLLPRIVLLIVLAQLLITLPAGATPPEQTIAVAVPNFNADNVKAVNLNGNATLLASPDGIRLTPALGEKAGSAFWKSRMRLASDRSFSSYFVISTSAPGGNEPKGADGIVFSLQTQSNLAGGTGGGLGYKGITPSIGVEFDTWQNDDVSDPNDNHVGLDVGGSVASVATSTALPGQIQDNTWHVWVDYNGATQNLQVRMSATNNRPADPVLNTTRDLSGDIGQDVYVGFTAGTGGAWENHDVQTFYFASEYLPIDTTTTTYHQTPNNVAVSASSPTITVGTKTAITVTVRDILDRLVPNQNIALSTTLGTLSALSGTTDANGQVSVELFTGSTIGVATVVARTDYGISSDTAVTVEPNSLAVSASSPTIPVGTKTRITVTVRDILQDKPVPGDTITFSTNLGTLSALRGITDANGQVSVELTGSALGLATVVARTDYGISSNTAVTVEIGRAHV